MKMKSSENEFLCESFKKEIYVGVLTLHRKIGHVYKDITVRDHSSIMSSKRGRTHLEGPLFITHSLE